MISWFYMKKQPKILIMVWSSSVSMPALVAISVAIILPNQFPSLAITLLYLSWGPVFLWNQTTYSELIHIFVMLESNIFCGLLSKNYEWNLIVDSSPQLSVIIKDVNYGIVPAYPLNFLHDLLHVYLLHHFRQDPTKSHKN